MPWTLANAFVSSLTSPLSVTNTSTGEVRVVGTLVSSGSTTITVAGGGVTTWNAFGAGFAPTNLPGFTARMFWGITTATGANNITVTGTAGSAVDVASGAFTPPAGTVSQDGSQGTANGTATTCTWPSITPAGSGELFFGWAVFNSAGSNGSTSGFVYFNTSGSNETCYNLSAPSPSAPTCPAGSGGWGAMDGFLYIPAAGATYAPRGLVSTWPVRRASNY